MPVILRTAALLPAFSHSSHILLYAPRDIFTWRLAAIRII
ncbi:hypothetical protein PROVRETT_09696 [Providencia rettgeri DSM 1131]|nr:hypothetical protein PROVRETT_09696 [Providencia rettgeri DSM 1131]